MPAMLKTLSPGPDPGFEPEPRFASDAEIALAEQLRRQLEERYFGSSPSTTSQARLRQDH
jgi:hypothetical protein